VGGKTLTTAEKVTLEESERAFAVRIKVIVSYLPQTNKERITMTEIIQAQKAGEVVGEHTRRL